MVTNDFQAQTYRQKFKGVVIPVSPPNAKLQLFSMHHVCKAPSACAKGLKHEFIHELREPVY